MSKNSKLEKVEANFNFSLLPREWQEVPGLLKDLKIAVAEKSKVKKGQVLASLRTGMKKAVFNLAEDLGVAGKKVSGFLRKKEGDVCRKGDLLASGRKKAVYASLDGKLGTLSEDGVLEILFGPFEWSLESHFDGTVKKLSRKELVLTFPAWQVKGDWSLGEQKEGDLLVEKVFLWGDEKQVTGKILLLEKLGCGLWHKLAALGVSGLVALDLEDDLRDHLVQFQELSPRFFPTTLFLGDLKKDDLSFLSNLSGKKVFIDSTANSLLVSR